jgi:S1-C subfamily serine protease
VLATTGDGPAAGAGISQGDVIVSIDGHDITSDSDLSDILRGLSPDDSVPVAVVGPNGEQRTIDVTLGTRPLPIGALP